MPKGCKYIYNNKTYTREEFMALLAGGEYRNILASNEMPVTTGMTDLDIAEIESTGILGTGTISLKSKSSRSKYIDSLKLERLPVHDNVSVVTGVDPETLNGQVVSSTLSDKLVAGVLRGKDSSFKFLGGIGYGPATGRWWAFSRMSDAETLIRTTEISKDGYKYLVPALMSDTSHLSNKNMTIMVMNLFKEAAANKELNTKQFKALVDKTFDRVDLVRHKPYITKVMKGHTNVDELIQDIQDAVVSGKLTFEDRKAMVSSFVGDSIVNKPKFKTVGTITELASDLAEPMAKNVPLHNAVVVYRTKGDLKAVETDKGDEFYHESYGVHIESSSEIEVLYLDGAYPITDLIPEFTTKGTKKSPSKTYRTSEEVLSKVAKGWTAERALTNLGRTHGLSAYSAPINIKTKSRVSASPEQFSNNVAETIDRIKAATSEDGATLNIDGTVYEDGGLVVPAGSVNVSQKGVSAEGLYKFLKDNENNISSDIFKIGLYKFPDRAEVSYDLNIVIPREHRDVALEFGKLAGQESLFDLDSYENIKTGSDGKNPITFTPEQLASIAEDLSNGVLPDIEGMLKGTQEGSAVGGDVEVNYISGKEQDKIIRKHTHIGEEVSTRWADWFLGESSDAKSAISHEIANNPELQNAMKSKLYDLWKKQNKSDISFNDFINSEIDLFRGGKVGNRNETNVEGFNSWELTEEGAKKFAKGEPVTKVRKKVKDLYGAVDIVGGEIEILEPTRYSEKYAERVLNHQEMIDKMFDNLSRDEQKRVSKLMMDGKYNDALELANNLLKPKAAEQSLKETPVSIEGEVDVEDKFKQYEKGYNKVQAAEGGAKKRKANEELKNILADSPSAKYIIDNMSYIYKQLEDKGLASKNDQCPI